MQIIYSDVLNTPLEFEQPWISTCISKSRTYIKKDKVSPAVTNISFSNAQELAERKIFAPRIYCQKLKEHKNLS